MSMTDPISDMLTRIRNGQKAKKLTVSMPSSKLVPHGMSLRTNSSTSTSSSSESVDVDPNAPYRAPSDCPREDHVIVIDDLEPSTTNGPRPGKGRAKRSDKAGKEKKHKKRWGLF